MTLTMLIYARLAERRVRTSCMVAPRVPFLILSYYRTSELLRLQSERAWGGTTIGLHFKQDVMLNRKT